ncbi:hypothetical protein [Mycobacterium sp. KBS0706]|uniref:hypothetical protein n=1 Tax=Mycobacterium sp. KBS0706 TaxID=2578109 RepID=UPI00163D78DA|nr:hypothetical protein [Mycobacterium sp. KBS0706]
MARTRAGSGPAAAGPGRGYRLWHHLPRALSLRDGRLDGVKIEALLWDAIEARRAGMKG